MSVSSKNKISLILLFNLVGCASPTYTKVSMSPLETDKAQCHLMAERDLAYARGTLATYFRGLELEESCMRAKGYSQ